MDRTHKAQNHSLRKIVPDTTAAYHPFFFALMVSCAVAELGLAAFLVCAGNEHQTWPSPRYHSLLIMFLFNAAWTTLFCASYLLWFFCGSSQFLAGMASSVIWLVLTSALWGVAAGVMHVTRSGGNCAGRETISRCRQSLTVEALGWTEFGLCLLTVIMTCLWIKGKVVHGSPDFVVSRIHGEGWGRNQNL